MGQRDVLGSLSASTPLDFGKIQEMSLLWRCMREALRMYPPLIMLIREAGDDREYIKALHKKSGRTKGFHTSALFERERAKDADWEVVKRHIIPKGDQLFVCSPVAHRLPAPDGPYASPETFDPDRFAEPREEDKSKPFAFISFGGGIHSCRGEQFAYLQLRVILSVMLRRFDIELTKDEIPKPNLAAMVVGPTPP